MEMENKAEHTLVGCRGIYSKLFVRPEYPTTNRFVTSMEDPQDRISMCFATLHEWALQLVDGQMSVITKMVFT